MTSATGKTSEDTHFTNKFCWQHEDSYNNYVRQHKQTMAKGTEPFVFQKKI